MKQKVGIITMYYNSLNYGGLLQAYALQKIITNLNYDCVQITFDRGKRNIKDTTINKLKSKSFFSFTKWLFIKNKKVLINKIAKTKLSDEIQLELNNKSKKFEAFRNEINHTKKCDKDTISDVTSDIDIFVCGSDQIWKPGIVCDEYTLKFVQGRKKISYAASISKNDISREDIVRLSNDISDLDYISLREQQDTILLKEHLHKDTKWVLDPTMILNESNWYSISKQRIIDGEYIFCYILGLNNRIVKSLNIFAKKNNLKLITIPFSDGNINFLENKINSTKLYDAGPQDFLSLIRYAKFVVTDSFHATVFSNIFEVPYYVIERDEEISMNNRITSLLSIFNTKNRFIKSGELSNKIIDKMNFDKKSYLIMKRKSIEFLETSLGGK